jgi:hypothetical protein
MPQEDSSPQRPAAALAQRTQPTQLGNDVNYLLLNPELDPNAVVNVRAAPASDAEVLGTISHQTGPVACCSFEGDWARLGDGSPGGADGWVLRLLPDGG